MAVLKGAVKRLLRAAGYKVQRLTPVTDLEEYQRWLIACAAVDVVVDVGANTGQFARRMREEVGFRGKIVSFEPLRAAFSTLADHARGDDRWHVVNCALGERRSRAEINVSANSYSSSLLGMLPAHTSGAPDSGYVAKEIIEVTTLDDALPDLRNSNASVYLKIDTQGYESHVLRGAQLSLPKIDIVQLELSLVPLYEGQALFPDIHSHMIGNGYSLVVAEPEFREPRTGRLLQMDGIYHRFRR